MKWFTQYNKNKFYITVRNIDTYFVIKSGNPLKVKNVGYLYYNGKVEDSYCKVKWYLENFNKEEYKPERKQSKDGFDKEAEVEWQVCYVKE